MPFVPPKKIDFLSMPIDFYYTSNKRTCLHLQNVLFFKKFYFGQSDFSFGQHTIQSIVMPPLFSAVCSMQT